VTPKKLLDKAATTLLTTMVGSCSCNANTPEIIPHSLGCRYRLLSDVYQAIIQAKGKL
jgi:hypothetical protein